MNKKSDRISRRIVASLLALLMVVSILPLGALPVAGANEVGGDETSTNETESKGITITVKDEDGELISGARVDFTIESKKEKKIKYQSSGTTSELGELDVLSSDLFVANDLYLNATISKEGYQEDEKTIKSILLTSATLTIPVTLISDQITGIEASTYMGTYDGKEKMAITGVSGVKAGDIVQYKLGSGDWQDDIPMIKNAGNYPIMVKVEREGCQAYIGDYTATINKATFEVVFDANNHVYDETEHDALTYKSGMKDSDQISYIYNDVVYKSCPKFKNAGEYKVSIVVKRDDNYVDYTADYNIIIDQAEIDGVKAKLNSDLTYNTKSQKLVKEVTGCLESDLVEYSMDDGVTWSKDEPEQTEAGTYNVQIRVTRNDNYHIKYIKLDPSTITIQKEEQDVNFKKKYDEEFTIDFNNSNNNIYDFSAVNQTLKDVPFVYSVENATDDETVDIDSIATINSSGQLTLLKGGYFIKVTAFVPGNENYKDGSVDFILYIKNTEQNLITFAEQNKVFYLGTNNVISDMEAVKSHKSDHGAVTYSAAPKDSSLSLEETGIKIDPDNGKLTISDLKKLSQVITNRKGDFSIIVTAHKEVGRRWCGFICRDLYNSANVSYTIQFLTESIPDGAYTLKDPEGNVITDANGNHGWYNTAVTVEPAEGYQIAKDIVKDFQASVVFDDQGVAVRKVYLRNVTTGAITEPITIAVNQIDSVAPDYNQIAINYSAPYFNKDKKIEDGVKFYQSEVTVTISAYDSTSGIEKFDWKYNRSSDASISNLEKDSGTLTAVQDENNKEHYTASLVLPENAVDQLRGNLSVVATDQAGKISDEKIDTGNVIIVDNISPTQTVTYQLNEDGGTQQTVDQTHYFSNDVVFTFNIVEANFYAEDVNITVTKNNEQEKQITDLTWENTENLDEHQAKLILSEEGSYTVNMTYTDRSGEPMSDYHSDLIVIDKTAPVISFLYASHGEPSTPQVATISVTDHNFRQSDLVLKMDAKDIAGNVVAVNDLQEYLRTCTWTTENDTHTTTISTQFVDAIYELTFDYSDLALNPAEQVNSGSFIVDHKGPDYKKMSVTYSTPLLEKILAGITFGYYKPSVKVTFTGYDETSGIDKFHWQYQRENGVSLSNIESYGVSDIDAVQDSSDLTKFTASVTLPKEDADQLRGSITYYANDKFNNSSETITDDKHVIVVDSIAPTMTASYTEADRTVGNKMYYNNAATATFTVTEANFYAEDVNVTVSKNGGTPYAVTPEWSNQSTDLHTGTYTIEAPDNHANDGDYVIAVSYHDRSENVMKNYTSNVIVIDTTAPVISVSYENQDVNNVLEDYEGNERSYYDDTQIASVTITEHNFNPDEVDLSILAKDVKGNALDVDALQQKSSWMDQGDNHTLTITYPGDANYTFDMDYTDLATNVADDYAKDYFTVDTTKPDNLAVSYSSSILDTVISNITFGFYQAPLDVTISASDSISGIHQFNYSYLNADGVSSSNAQLEDQSIEESDLLFSDQGATATATFSIPREALDSEHQFNGNVIFNARDRSDNDSDDLDDTTRLVVDNISPDANIQYNTPVQTLDGISYYDGNINTTITINEANFYPDDVMISVNKDGAAYAVSPTWDDENADVHTGTFTLTEDGDYFISVTYSDKSNNSMGEYTSNQLTIDTVIEDATILDDGEDLDGKAFKDEVIPSISFEDINFQDYEIILTRTNFGSKNIDVTNQFIADHTSINEKGGNGIFNTFDKIAENDGIYILTVRFSDKAGHRIEKTAKFTVNRFGSVYEYDDYLVSLIKDGGAYVQNIDNDLVITEYNADKLLSKSLNIEISKDGKPFNISDYKVSPDINDQVETGNSGWYEYQYTINKDNFNSDGVYKIAVSSADATGNTPETTNYSDKTILFHVDTTPPEINSITGLSNKVINATNVDVKYTVYDSIGLDSVSVYVDGNEREMIDDLSKDHNNYAGNFTLSESSSAQTVRIVVKDLAGNITDTDSSDFTSAYAFNHSVTVSTNIFVRWFANKGLFWGSIGGIAALLIIIAVMVTTVVRKRKVKE